MEKRLLKLLGHASNERDMEYVYEEQEWGSKISGFRQFCHKSLHIRETTVIGAEEVIL